MRRPGYVKRASVRKRPASAAPAPAPSKRLTAKFYRTAAGNEPVRIWLKDLDVKDRKIVGEDIGTVEFGWPIGMPVCRAVSNGLREVRSTIMDGRVEARVYFDVIDDVMLLLHAETGKAGQDDAIKLAGQRLSDFQARAAKSAGST